MQGHEYLEVDTNIGINCNSKNTMVIHPSEMFMIYAVGSLLVIKSVDETPDKYIRGHSGRINFITASKSGALLATGEAHDLRSEECATLIIWDFASLEIMYRVRYHK